MQSLERTLQDHDLGHLRILAELWGLDLPSGSSRQVVEVLKTAMLDPIQVNEIVESLTPPIRQLLDYMLNHNGRVPLSDLVHRFGTLREMGPGRRDREGLSDALSLTQCLVLENLPSYQPTCLACFRTPHLPAWKHQVSRPTLRL
jgi:hypothetical protein